MDTPLPRVTKPMMGSGGAGRQQRARLVIRVLTPTTSTPDSVPLLPGFLLFKNSMCSSSDNLPLGAGSIRSAFSMARGRISSRVSATYRSSGRSKPSFWASVSRFTAVWPMRCSSRSAIARPRSSVSLRSCCANHCFTFWRARWLIRYFCVGFSQSREGPVAASPRALTISTVCPLSNGVFSCTICPFTFAPRQRWPSSVCTW